MKNALELFVAIVIGSIAAITITFIGILLPVVFCILITFWFIKVYQIEKEEDTPD